VVFGGRRPPQRGPTLTGNSKASGNHDGRLRPFYRPPVTGSPSPPADLSWRSSRCAQWAWWPSPPANASSAVRAGPYPDVPVGVESHLEALPIVAVEARIRGDVIDDPARRGSSQAASQALSEPIQVLFESG
jgi:hypothetical protein